MPIISVFAFEELPNVPAICKALNGKKIQDSWFNAKPSNYNSDEAFIQFWYYEDLEDSLRKLISEDDAHEIITFLKKDGKDKVLKRTYCFINLFSKTLEIYRGDDARTGEIVSYMEKFLNIKFKKLSFASEDLQKIYKNHSLELKQVMFKNVEGLIYDILRANNLESNVRFKEYLQLFPESLRVISFRPRIRFLDGHNKYQVTLNGDRGTIRLSSNEVFKWRPRYEIRQLTYILASTAGLIKS